MNQPHPKVSVIVATFRPGDGLARVVDSLDAQTLPQDEFEVIYVDDGSGDDTVSRLQALAATRPNVRVAECEHSGWSGRPRNVGTDLAKGEYVLFMDHDDSLYPDGLRRAHEYAKETGADILSPKESKTNDTWWGLSPHRIGNIPNLRADGGISNLIPMVPHKLYRRSLLVEHQVRFPEGSRALWEDWYINLGSYRHADVVSVLADTPVYLWHASDTNTSHTFDPAREDYWDRLGDVLDFATDTFGSSDRDSLEAVVAHNLRIRVIDRCVRLVARGSVKAQTKLMVLTRAQELLELHGTEGVLSRLPRKHQAQACLLRSGRTDLMAAFLATDLSLTASVDAVSPYWDGSVLRYDTEMRWEPKKSGQTALVSRDGRVVRHVSQELEKAIPPELLDVTDPAANLNLRVAVRDRLQHVSWPLETEVRESAYVVNDAGALCVIQRGQGAISLDGAASGEPLPPSVWDVRFRAAWDGMVRTGSLLYEGGPRPVIAGGRAAVAYSNQSMGLSLDLGQRTRTFATDAAPRTGYAGPISGFSTVLENVTAADDTVLGLDDVVAIAEGAIPPDAPADEQSGLREQLARSGGLDAEIVVTGKRALLRGSASLSPGRYALYARRSGKLHGTRYALRVDQTGHAHFSVRS